MKKSFIKKFRKRFSSKSFRNSSRNLLDIFTVIYFLAGLIFFISSIMNISSKNLLFDLKINIFLYIIIFFATFIIFVFMKKISDKSKEKFFILNFLRRRNYWTFLTISILITFLVLSLNLYNTYTNYPLPIEGYLTNIDNDIARDIVNNNLIQNIFLKCYNFGGERDYIIDKEVFCGIDANYSANFSFYLHKIERIFIYKNGSQNNKERTTDLEQIRNFSQKWNFEIPIDSDFKQALIRFYFVNISDSENLVYTHHFWIVPERILTESSYNDKRERSFLFFLTAFSILIFSTIISIKNFMDIWYKNSRISEQNKTHKK